MEKEPFTLKDPTTVLEINGMRYGAGYFTKEKVLELIGRDSIYMQYFNMPEAPKKKPKKIKIKDE